MKVDNLLGPYLYQYKKLFLPGIGLFILDDKAVLPDDSAKIKSAIEGISFTVKPGTELDDSLVQFIKQETGKMKALAEADLHSYIATAFQFLNIGKPFYFEGIGTLIKNKDNKYVFTAGTVISQKAEEPQRHHDSPKRTTHSSDTESKSSSSFNAGKLVVALGILITIALIGWGGHYLYSKNTTDSVADAPIESKPMPASQNTTAIANVVPDSSGKKPLNASGAMSTDSTVVVKNDAVTAPVNGFKFILESTGKKTRALKRYEQLKDVSMLKSYNNKIMLETPDSVSFKIYTIVSCAATDTSSVKDQLNAWYYGTKEIKVKLEH